MRLPGVRTSAIIARMDTLALDFSTGSPDLTVDQYGNWATFGDATPGDLTGPGMRLAQDVATRCMAWRGEVYYDTTQGVRYETILGYPPNLALMNNAFSTEALKVPLCQTAIANFDFTAGPSRKVGGTITVSDINGTSGSVQIT